jgi:hypothetical protein
MSCCGSSAASRQNNALRRSRRMSACLTETTAAFPLDAAPAREPRQSRKKIPHSWPAHRSARSQAQTVTAVRQSETDLNRTGECWPCRQFLRTSAVMLREGAASRYEPSRRLTLSCHAARRRSIQTGLRVATVWPKTTSSTADAGPSLLDAADKPQHDNGVSWLIARRSRTQTITPAPLRSRSGAGAYVHKQSLRRRKFNYGMVMRVAEVSPITSFTRLPFKS